MKAALPALLVLAIAFVAWRLWPASGTGVPNAPASVTDRMATSAASKAAAAAPVDPTSARPVDDRPFAEMRAELEGRAEAGDARAAMRLAWVFAKCNRYETITDAQIEAWVVDASAKGIGITEEDGSQLTPVQMVEQMKTNRAQLDHDCRGVSGVNEANAGKLGRTWLRRAAALGDSDAQAAYGGSAFEAFGDRTALADAEGIREEVRLARSYVERALAQGNGFALLQMFSYLKEGVLYPADDRAAYAYLYAYSLTPRSADLTSASLELLFLQTGRELDDEAIARARDEGRRLAACCMKPAGATP